MRQLFGGLPVAEIPLSESDVHGLDSLHSLALGLHGDEPILPEDMKPISVSNAIPINLRRGLNIRKDEEELLVEMYLPAANKEDLNLRSEGNNLYIGVNGREARIEVGHRVKVKDAEARFEDDILRLTVKDESLD